MHEVAQRRCCSALDRDSLAFLETLLSFRLNQFLHASHKITAEQMQRVLQARLPARAGARQPARPGGGGGPPNGLSAEQQRALALVQGGQNVFLTGGAGVGKSHTLRAVLAALRQRYGQELFGEKVAVTAPTGIAASHVGGTTLHAATGVRHRPGWSNHFP